MSRAWMPLYWGDYLRDTGHLTTVQHGAYLLLIGHYWQHGSLPTEDRQLAAIARLSLKQFMVIRDPLSNLFTNGWQHKRIEDELARADKIQVRRKLSGAKGGFHSAIAKAKAIANAQAFGRANATANGVANTPAKSEQKDTQAQSKKEREEEPARSLASALPTGALAPSPEKESKRPFEGKKPNEMTRQELDDFYAAKRAKEGKPEPKPEPLREQVKRDVEFLETPF